MNRKIVKLSLFVHDMIQTRLETFYPESLNEFIRKQFSKMVRYKINTQKSLTFLYMVVVKLQQPPAAAGCLCHGKL